MSTPCHLLARGRRVRTASLGFSLIELLVALMLIIIGSLAAVTMQRTAVKQGNLTRDRQVAAWLARQLVERVRQMRYADPSLAITSPTNTFVNPPSGISPANNLNEFGQNSATGTYQRQWIIDSPSDNVKRVQVRVSWSESGITERMIMKATLKAR